MDRAPGGSEIGGWSTHGWLKPNASVAPALVRALLLLAFEHVWTLRNSIANIRGLEIFLSIEPRASGDENRGGAQRLVVNSLKVSAPAAKLV